MDCGWMEVDGCWTVDRLMMDGLWRDGQMDGWMDDTERRKRIREKPFFPRILL